MTFEEAIEIIEDECRVEAEEDLMRAWLHPELIEVTDE